MSDETLLEAPELASAPQRIISLVPSLTESLFELALGERVIAVTDYCVHPAQKVASLPRIGGTKNPNVKQIIDMKPDLVFANKEENRRKDVEALQAAGIPVWITYPRTVQDVFNLLWEVMEVCEETSMVPRVRHIEQLYDWVAGISRAKEDEECRVFVPIWKDPYMSFNTDTYIHDLLRVCGGTNVFAGASDRYPRVTLDAVAAAAPDIVLLPSEPYGFTEQDIPVFEAMDIPAAWHKRIRLVDGSLLTWHGTRVAHALSILPELLCSGDKRDERSDG